MSFSKLLTSGNLDCSAEPIVVFKLGSGILVKPRTDQNSPAPQCYVGTR